MCFSFGVSGVTERAAVICSVTWEFKENVPPSFPFSLVLVCLATVLYSLARFSIGSTPLHRQLAPILTCGLVLRRQLVERCLECFVKDGRQQSESDQQTMEKACAKRLKEAQKVQRMQQHLQTVEARGYRS